MYNADTQCMVEGREEAKEQEKNVLWFFKIEICNTVRNRTEGRIYFE